MDDDSSDIIDNLRANWTPSMDHYFLELLLEHVHRENKTGHLVSKQAWAEMIAQFNTKFGFKYDIDVLKNRYERFRKQYSAIKIIVDRNGFRWDETRQMVTADDYVWAEYIELLIYSLSCFDVDFDNEEKRMNDQTPTNDDCKKIDWSETMDQYFLELMLDQVHKGNKIGRTFKKKAWLYMSISFNAKFGFEHGKVVLKNRYNIFRRHYSSIKILLGQRGFSWDETQKMVIAEDHVWNKYIKAHPNFRMYRNKRMSDYMDMCTICGNEATSVKNHPLSHKLSFKNGNTARNMGEDAVPVFDTDVMHDAHKATLDSGVDRKLSKQQRSHRPKMPQNLQQPKKARRIDEGMADTTRKMKFTDASSTKKKENENCISTKNVIDTLQAIPGIDDDLLLDACDLLEDEGKARMFLALDATLRKKWLMRKLRPQL